LTVCRTRPRERVDAKAAYRASPRVWPVIFENTVGTAARDVLVAIQVALGIVFLFFAVVHVLLSTRHASSIHQLSTQPLNLDRLSDDQRDRHQRCWSIPATVSRYASLARDRILILEPHLMQSALLTMGI
jgi:hypothetical protein